MPEYIVIALRSIFAFFFVLVLTRILGKKQISQITFFDYINGIALGSITAQLAISTKTDTIYPIVGLVIFTLLTLIVDYSSIKSSKLRSIFEGEPRILMKEGKVLEKNLRKEQMTFNDLMTGLREKNVFKLADVELAVLETDGKISVMKKTEKEPLTPKDIGLVLEKEKAPSLLIVDGFVLTRRLHYLGYTEEWLQKEIKKHGASDVKDVFLAQIDSKGNLYVDLHQDDEYKEQREQQKPFYAAELRKIQANLESIASQTKDQTAKNMYYQQANEIQDIITKVNPYLQTK